MPTAAEPNVITVPFYRQDLGTGPLIFLAGPIQQAPNWQAEAIRLIASIRPQVLIANPRGPEPWHGDYKAQVDWERFHLNHASKQGIILFWMARETSHNCERNYAQTTRVEWGRMFERHLNQGARIAIGVEEGFSGEKYVRDMVSTEAPNLHVHHNLSETCQQTIDRLGY